jgi:hypothetical protein
MNYELLLIAFVALTGFALLAQAIILLALFLNLKKGAKKLQEDFDELRGNLTPVLIKSRDLLEHVGPNIESISTDLVVLVRGLREQGAEIQATTSDALERFARQSNRLDTMFTKVLDGVDEASSLLAESVSKPVRKVSAVIASVKAFLGTLTTGRREPGSDGRDARRADQDMFV